MPFPLRSNRSRTYFIRTRNTKSSASKSQAALATLPRPAKNSCAERASEPKHSCKSHAATRRAGIFSSDSTAAKQPRHVFLESWAYVTDGHSGHFGCSGALELPEPLAHEVLERGIELSEAIDRFAGAVGIRDAQGAWGVLSRNLISRQEAFRIAVIAAFAPFYNRKMYQQSQAMARGGSL
jgi:non-canonical (house-cleaning) NTP pyrophosphatase